MQRHKKIKLHGFNNLTKTLSFNIYDINYAETTAQQNAYIEYIDEEYNAERLTSILSEVAQIIGANILNIAHQDYDPQGRGGRLALYDQRRQGPQRRARFGTGGIGNGLYEDTAGNL